MTTRRAGGRRVAKADELVPIFATRTHVSSTYAPAAHSHAAADITSGVLNIARVATGTPDGTKFVRDDSTLQVP